MKPRARDGVILLMAILAIVGAFLHGDGRWLHWLAKPATTLLIAAIAWQVRDPAQPFYRRAVLAGMLLSCVGDIALMLPVDAFVPGLVAFLLAHLCYIVAFRDGLRAGRGLRASVLLGAFAVLNVLGLWPHLPAPMRIPVLAYVVVLASMAVLAWHGSGADRSPMPWKPAARAGRPPVRCCSSPAIHCWPGTASPAACRWPACWCCPPTTARSTPSPAR
jgi:uncharacterized membrane protein YhhN